MINSKTGLRRGRGFKSHLRHIFSVKFIYFKRIITKSMNKILIGTLVLLLLFLAACGKQQVTGNAVLNTDGSPSVEVSEKSFGVEEVTGSFCKENSAWDSTLASKVGSNKDSTTVVGVQEEGQFSNLCYVRVLFLDDGKDYYIHYYLNNDLSAGFYQIPLVQGKKITKSWP